MKTPTKVWARVPHDRSGRAAYPHAAAPWPKVRLGEIAECTLGKMLDHKKNHGIPQPYLANFNVRWGEFDLTDVSMMPMEPEEFEKYELKRGDLVICEGGEIGRCALWKEQVSGMKIQKALHRVRVKDGVDSTYLYYWFLNSGRSDFFKQFTTGATILHLPRQNLLEIPIPLPPLPIQRRIASVLGAYDDLIENNRRRIALLEKMARELYRERFVRRAGKGNTVTLGEIMSITRGLSYTSKEIDTEDGVNLINLKNIRSFGGFREEGTKKYSGDYKNAQVVKKGDLVMGVTDMTQERRTVGAVALLPDLEGESVLSADLIKIDSDFGNCFLFCMFCYGGVSSQIGQFATGATVLHLRPQAVLDFSVTLPVREEVEAFESQIFPLFEEQGNLLSQNRSLTRQRDRLLPRLMSGKIDVEALVKEEK